MNLPADHLPSFRHRVYLAVEAPPHVPRKKRHRAVSVLIATLILLNVLSSMLATVRSIESRYAYPIYVFEFASAWVFLAEFALRWWACVEHPKYRHPVWGRLRYLVSPLAMIDLLAIVPTLLTSAGVDLMVLRLARLFRIGRVLALGRYNTALTTLARVVGSRAAELAIMCVTMMFVLVIAATMMYYLEHDAQPHVFSSIPAAMWWAVITLTTIGYGDAYPVTPAGKLLGGFVALCGIGVVALPTAVIAQAYAEELHSRRARKDPTPTACPHCGKPLH